MLADSRNSYTRCFRIKFLVYDLKQFHTVALRSFFPVFFFFKSSLHVKIFFRFKDSSLKPRVSSSYKKLLDPQPEKYLVHITKSMMETFCLSVMQIIRISVNQKSDVFPIFKLRFQAIL